MAVVFKIGDKVYSEYTKSKDEVLNIINESCVFGIGKAYLMKSGNAYWVKNNNISFNARKQQLKKI